MHAFLLPDLRGLAAKVELLMLGERVKLVGRRARPTARTQSESLERVARAATAATAATAPAVAADLQLRSYIVERSRPRLAHQFSTLLPSAHLVALVGNSEINQVGDSTAQRAPRRICFRSPEPLQIRKLRHREMN